MYVSVRRYRMKNPGMVAELMRRVEAEFADIVSKAPGFVAYYAVDSGNETVASISVFQDQSGAEESNRLAADWVRGNLVGLVEIPPDTTAGEVVVQRSA